MASAAPTFSSGPIPVQPIQPAAAAPPGSGDASRRIRFVRRGEIVSLSNVPPTRTLLELLREDLSCTGTKEGCGEGDCGACTVVLAEPADPAHPGQPGEAGLKYRAVNSCIRLAHSIDGLALWTVEDLAADPLLGQTRPAHAPPALHPAQEAMVQCHASQCGFCTPGFVMSLFGMYQTHGPGAGDAARPITRALAQRELSGNLCRCTGYRPILDAARHMVDLPVVRVNESRVLDLLGQIRPGKSGSHDAAYLRPTTLAELLSARAARPRAQLVAGCTDVGLWITKQHLKFDQVIDLTRVGELRRVKSQNGHLQIGAAVPLEDAFAAMSKVWPVLGDFAARFAGLPVRQSGTLGGNVANGSPIGDAMPLLIAMGARLVLVSVRGEREMPIEDFYTGYRKNLLAGDEVLAFIKVPLPAGRLLDDGSWLRVYKISKRYDDDISAVCLALALSVRDGLVHEVSIGAGGVAATPVRADATEATLIGQPWTAATVRHAMQVLSGEFEPISDMRASAAYRRQVLGNLLQRFWLESQGAQHINLASFTLDDLS
jgi:xanthine dehydrogenase small subunit